MADDETIDPSETDGNVDEQDATDSGSDDLETWKRHARKWERTAKENAEAAKRAEAAERELSEIRESSKTEHEKQLDKVRLEATEEARKDAFSRANARIVKSEVRVAAAGKLADPEDAVRFLNLDEFVVDDDGNVEAKAISDAVARLLKDKPYLAANAGTRRHGDADQGARGRATSGASMNDLIRRRAGR